MIFDLGNIGQAFWRPLTRVFFLLMTRVSNYGESQARKVELEVDIAVTNLLFVPSSICMNRIMNLLFGDGFHML